MNQGAPQNLPLPKYSLWRSKRMVSRETRRIVSGAHASSTAVAFCNTRKRCRCVCRGNPCGCPLYGADGVQMKSPLFALCLTADCHPLPAVFPRRCRILQHPGARSPACAEFCSAGRSCPRRALSGPATSRRRRELIGLFVVRRVLGPSVAFCDTLDHGRNA